MTCPHYAGFTRAMCHRCLAEDRARIPVRESKRDAAQKIMDAMEARKKHNLETLLNEIAKGAKKRGL